MRRLDLPGMYVLLMAFDSGPDNPYLPRNYSPNSVVYTGTHDTNTVRGWFRDEANARQKKRLLEVMGRELFEEEASWEFICLALNSAATLSIVPTQDILSLGSEARMNLPSTSEGNWEWKVTTDQLSPDAFRKLGEETQAAGRR